MSDLELLKHKLAEWKAKFSGNDVHSVSQQIATLLWRSAFYRSVNESRRFAPDDEHGEKQANGSLHESIDNGYFILNSLAIRRLIDKGPATGPKGVYSLYGLVAEILTNLQFITRENVIGARGLNYDFEPFKRRAFEAGLRVRGFGISKDGWFESEYWHGAMDKLAGVTPDDRDPSDRPNQQRLESLLDELETHSLSIKDWVDKFVAHAATPESRQVIPSEHQSLSLAKLWRAERVLLRAAGLISLYFIDGTNLGGVPIPQFDQFAYLDRPFIASGALEAMERAWRQHSSEVNACQNWFWDRPLMDGSDVWTD